jgi:hypothetical protein
MLISKSSYDVGDIITFKIVNGDELVARLVEQNDTGFIVDRPCTVVPSPKGIGLIQSLFTAELEQKITLDKQHVIMHAASIKDMRNHYIQTTSGISVIS